MKFPSISDPVHLVIGDVSLEVGRLVVEVDTTPAIGVTPRHSGSGAVLGVSGVLKFDPEFVAFIERHAALERPEQG